MRRAVAAELLLGLTLATAQPLQNRILIATSADGLAWQRTGTVFCDSGDVPDAVRGPDGRFYVHYQGLWTHTMDGIMVGISADGINDWTFHQVQLPGTSGWPGRPCDPDVILFGDTFRLYFTGDPVGDGYPETHSAVSLDGFNFTVEPGIRFEAANRMVLDPSLVRTGDTLQYFAGGATPGANWHAHSIDGLTFARQPDVAVDSLMFSNGLALDSGFRFYGFRNMPPNGIKSVFSPDGGTWNLEPGWRLELDSTSPLEYRYVKDAAVVRTDSGFIMYYVTRKRETGIAEVATNEVRKERTAATFIRGGVLFMQTSDFTPRFSLLDMTGRQLMTLHPGANDISHLSPGVYFVRAFSREPSAVNYREVVVTR